MLLLLRLFFFFAQCKKAPKIVFMTKVLFFRNWILYIHIQIFVVNSIAFCTFGECTWNIFTWFCFIFCVGAVSRVRSSKMNGKFICSLFYFTFFCCYNAYHHDNREIYNHNFNTSIKVILGFFSSTCCLVMILFWQLQWFIRLRHRDLFVWSRFWIFLFYT